MNKARKQVVEVADLLSLESWDFSAVGTEGTACSTTIEEDTSSASLLTVPSFEEDLDFNKESSEHKSSNVHVSVSGVIFAIDPIIFKRLEPLPWNLTSTAGEKVAASYKPKNDTGCGAYFNLDTSPVLFEMLLNFLMFGTFPDLGRLSLSDTEELEPLAALLNLRELQHHLAKKAHRGSFRFRRQQSNNGSATIKKLSSASTSSKSKTNDGAYTKKQPSSGSSSNNKDSTALPPAVRKMKAALLNRRLTQQQTKKMSHAEHCAMSDHLF